MSFPDLSRDHFMVRDLLTSTSKPSSEQQGWERYYDQTPEQREKALSGITELTKPFNRSDDKDFARGWLNALSAARKATQ